MKNILAQIVAIIMFFSGLWFYGECFRIHEAKVDRIIADLDLLVEEKPSVNVHVDFNDTRPTQVIRVTDSPAHTKIKALPKTSGVDLGALLDGPTGEEIYWGGNPE